MDAQYRFQLIFIKLILKRTFISDSSLTISLIQPNKQQTPYFQPDQIYIKRNVSVIKLTSLSPFRFSSSIESGHHATIKYEIKGKSQNLIRTVPLNISKMIKAFQQQNQSEFDQTFSGQSAQISYKCTIQKHETQNLNILVLPAAEDGFSPETRKRVGSLSKSKRPPTLNLNKKTLSPKASQKNLKSPQSGVKSSNSLGIGSNFFNDKESIISADINHLTVDSLKQMQKVKELISSHHRTQHHQQSHRLSIKLMIVFAMLIFGVLFLMYDTFSDRNRSINLLKKKSHKNQNSRHNLNRKVQINENKVNQKNKKKISKSNQ